MFLVEPTTQSLRIGAKKFPIGEPSGAPDVFKEPGHLVLPAFPLCIGRHLQTGQFSGPSFYDRERLCLRDQQSETGSGRNGPPLSASRLD
jgi:hypothetical protein